LSDEEIATLSAKGVLTATTEASHWVSARSQGTRPPPPTVTDT